MGAGGSSDRRNSSVGALNGAPVFQQRCQDTSGSLKGTKGISVDDSCDGDFSDISYSEGGGIISHQDIPIKNGQFNNQNTSTVPNSGSSTLKPSTTNHPCDPSPLPPPTPNNNPVDDSDKENNHNQSAHSHLPAFRAGGTGDTMSLGEGSVGVMARGGRGQKLQRAQSHDVRTSGHFFSGVNHSAGGSSSSNSAANARTQEKGGLLIERRTSQMSVLITPPPSDHPDPTKSAPPDLPTRDPEANGSIGSASQKPLQQLPEDLPPNTGDMTVEEVV